MRTRLQKILTILLPLSLLAGLPLLGIILAGKPVSPYTELPPITRYVPHAGFSWPVFIGLAALILVVVVPFILRLASSLRNSHTPTPPYSDTPTHSFPLWGWLGFAAGACAWVLAWTRFPAFAPLQPFTFSPLWFSYIVVINALTYWRSGRCMMLNRTRHFLCLFLASAVFWWFFEYLNRFVQNWYYVGVGDLTPLAYFIFATLPFSTVLPAVLGTEELLASFPATASGLNRFVKLDIRVPKTVAAITLAASCAGLAGIGVWPNYLFPLLWVSPVFVIVSLQALQGRDTILAPLRSGDWQRIIRLALAALICGFFWEMWNFHSLAKWIYAVPYVSRFHIFEMPVLGYAGYLPFGLECAVIGDMVLSIVGRDSEHEVLEAECVADRRSEEK